MCKRGRKPDDSTPKRPPPYVLALEDYDPYQHTSNVYDSQPDVAAPNVDAQLSFKRGERLRVVSDELDWWMLCENEVTNEKGYIATVFFAPICAVSTER